MGLRLSFVYEYIKLGYYAFSFICPFLTCGTFYFCLFLLYHLGFVPLSNSIISLQLEEKHRWVIRFTERLNFSLLLSRLILLFMRKPLPCWFRAISSEEESSLFKSLPSWFSSYSSQSHSRWERGQSAFYRQTCGRLVFSCKILIINLPGLFEELVFTMENRLSPSGNWFWNSRGCPAMSLQGHLAPSSITYQVGKRSKAALAVLFTMNP